MTKPRRSLHLFFLGATFVPMLWTAQLAVLTLRHHGEVQKVEQHSFDVPVPSSPVSSSEIDASYSVSSIPNEREAKETLTVAQDIPPPLFGFVRVPKTGSTSVLSFLTMESGLRPWSEFLYSASGFIEASPRHSEKKMPFCVYGHANHTSLTEKHDPNDGPNPFQLENVDQYYNDCPHMRYSTLQQTWNRSLQFFNPPTETSSRHPPLVLQSFSMLRDPFDRLRSLFFYTQKSCKGSQTNRKMFTAEQYDAICANDLKGWMKLLHDQGGGVTVAVPYQYRLFDTSLEHAMAMVRGDKPELIVLLNECFELSLRLIEKEFSLRVGATNDFLESPYYENNANRHAPKVLKDEKELREAAKLWFADDFKFYAASVEQFRRHVEASGIDVSSLQHSCPIFTKKEELAKDEVVAEEPRAKETVTSAGRVATASITHVDASPLDTKKLLGFIRIQKTGSTSLLAFLTYASGMHSWDSFIYSATDYVDYVGEDTYKKRFPFCVFGHANENATFEHDPRDEENPYDYHPRSRHNTCPHLHHKTVHRMWKKSKNFANHPEGIENLSVQSVTIVRDPFDRFRSFYYYVRGYCNKTQAWKNLFTPAQYEQICDGDFATFLELYHKEEKGDWVEYQYYFLDDKLDNAISMMDGDTPEVYMLLNECFEESLKFLEYKFSLKPGVTDAFVNSSKFRANTNKYAPERSPEEQALREKAERWFSKDYKFYYAAVKQFKRQVATMDLDPSTLQNPCDILRNKDSGKLPR